MTPALAGYAVSALTAAVGAIWWYREPVSAGRPGSFLVGMGALGAIVIVWHC